MVKIRYVRRAVVAFTRVPRLAVVGLLLLAALAGALLVLDARPGGAHTAGPFGAFISTPPTINGTHAAGEWSQASSTNFVIGGRAATVFVANNASDLFLSVRVDDPTDSGSSDIIAILFDNGHVGGSTRLTNDDGMQQSGGGPAFFIDTVWNGTQVASDTVSGGTKDGAGAPGFASGQWTFEVQHPLCSGDTRDFCLSSGSVVGFTLRISDAGALGDWPATNPSNPSQYGDIVVASAAFVDTTSDAVLTACTGAASDCSLRGAISNVSADPAANTITFSPAVFPPGAPATISLGSALPSLSAGNDTIDGSTAGVRLDGVTDTFVCFTLNSSGNTIRGIELITNCSTGIFITGADNTIGGGAAAHRNVISGNGPDPGGNGDGIEIDGAGATGNAIKGNYIGTNEVGTAAMANTIAGIRINGPGNTVGGTAPGDRNVLSGNDYGVIIEGAGATGNVVLGNYIGTDVSGNLDLGNAFEGVAIVAANNIVGGAAAGARNIISGNNRAGVEIPGSGNTVKGNYIGTNAAGTAAVANALRGVRMVAGATGNTVGGPAVADRNVISGNSGDGVLITGSGTNGNTVKGNYLGLNASGTGAIANGRGVSIDLGAQNNVVGGSTTPGSCDTNCNVISGNVDFGVRITSSGSTGNSVRGNFIGTNPAGTAAFANTRGVVIDGSAQSNTVGGATTGERNLISGNASQGVQIFSANSNLVRGNYIGTNAAGTAAVANANGVVIESTAQFNTIGGASAGHRNVISGNSSNGVIILGGTSTGNSVSGNYVGTNAAGTAALGNAGAGVYTEAPSNTVGGLTATPGTGLGNVVSGNNSGIVIKFDTADGTVVQGNLVGTNAAGTADVGNLDVGVYLTFGPDSTTIGGTAAGARNVISGNNSHGIAMFEDVTGTLVQGNYIGTDITGQSAIGNGNGIVLANGPFGNTIGGSTLAARNVIAGNTGDGIQIGSFGSAVTSTAVRGNNIGVAADGATGLGNGGSGVLVQAGSTGNTIGGVNSSDANVIALNSGDGVRVDGSGTTGNTVRSNSIHGNGLLGIENINGGNASLAVPVITSVNPETATIAGTTCSGCSVQVFSDGVDEGRVFHGFAVTTVTDWTFTGALVGPQLTATATNGSGSTSEFSASVPLVMLGAASGDTAPDTGGGTFGTNFDLGVNDGGQAVFHNTVTGGTATEGIFAFFAAQPVTSVAVRDQNTNTSLGGQYNSFGPPVNNNAGTIVSRATVVNGTASEGLFAFFAASPTEALAWQGGSAPGGGTFATFSSPAVNNLNQVAATANLVGGQQGLYAFFAASATVDKQLAIQGGSAPGGGTFTGFGDPSINDLGWVAARSTVSGPSEGLYAFFAAGTATELLAKTGDSAPGTGVNGKFNSFGKPSINNSGTTGRVAARATITDGTASEGIFAFFAASPIQALALQGQTAPGTGGATFVSFGDPVINDLGQVVVKATLTGGPGGAPTEGIFAFFAAAPSQEIVLEGDVAAEGGTYADFLFIAYNDVAQIVFVANVSGGPSAQGVFFASLDLDRDGIVDFQDNCPTVFNTDQHNNEGDARGNACDPDDDNDTICDPGQSDPACTGSDNCVFVGNTSQTDANANGIGDACDPADTDGDNFSDRLEARVGTSAALACGANAWPPDFNSDSAVTGADLSAIAADIGKAVPPAPQRKDIAPDLPDSAITGADLSAVAAVIGTNCN